MSYGFVYPIFAAMMYHRDPVFFDIASTASRGLWLGVLLAASPLAQFVSLLPVGALSDRIGRKPVLLATTLIIIVGYLLSALGIKVQSLFLVIFGRIISGIGASNIAVINSSVADFSSPESKSKNFALITMFNGLGFSIGPFLGGKLASIGFSIPFIFSALLTLLFFISISFSFSETLLDREKGNYRLRSELIALVKTAIFHKFRILFPAFFIFCVGWSFYWEFIPVTWIKGYQRNASQIGNFYAFGSACYVLSSGWLIRPILKKFNNYWILLCALAALGFFLFPLIDSPLRLYWIFIPLQQFTVALIFPVGTAIVSNLVAKSKQGETLGAFQALQSFAFAITPLLGGALIDLGYNMPLILSSIGMFLACAILFLEFKAHHLKQ